MRSGPSATVSSVDPAISMKRHVTIRRSARWVALKGGPLSALWVRCPTKLVGGVGQGGGGQGWAERRHGRPPGAVPSAPGGLHRRQNLVIGGKPTVLRHVLR